MQETNVVLTECDHGDDQREAARISPDTSSNKCCAPPLIVRPSGNLTGSVGSGKTSVLQLVQELIWEKNRIPLMLSAPAGEVDAGPIALLEAVDQLEAAHLLNGERDVINDPEVALDRQDGGDHDGHRAFPQQYRNLM